MKKFLLSAFVLTTFILYSIHVANSKARANTPIEAISTPSDNNFSGTLAPSPNATATISRQKYKDGSYVGDVADAFYGNIQVKVIISSRLITDVQFLQYPNDRATSIEINSQAMPLLRQEAIQAQSAQVDGVSGASQTSQAFIESLSSALQKAM